MRQQPEKLLRPLQHALSQDFALEVDGKRIAFTVTVAYLPRQCAEDDPGCHVLALSNLTATQTVKVPVKDVTR